MKNKNDLIIDILDQVGATNVRLYDYEKKSPFFDYVILATATDRQSNAAVGYMKKEDIVGLKNIEGRNNTGWVLADAGDVIVHLFTEQQRNVYKFDERLMGIKELKIVKPTAKNKITKQIVSTDNLDQEALSINTASYEQLIKIPHMTDARAKNLINYRKENGPFSSIEELLNVKGIGKTTFENIINLIRI